MKQKTFHNIFPFLSLLTALFLGNYCIAQNASNRPNIVWIVTEDNSKHWLKLYEEGGASMPAIEALAEKGIVFNHAFSQAPVCSVARSTIISGCYGPRVGSQYHRRTEFAPMPEGLEMFPAYLKKAGYYTSNNSKEDYNFIKSDQVWDESSRKASYKNRQPGQSFFHVQNFGITHEGRLHFSKEKMMATPTEANPDEMTPFPYHPNTPDYRYTYAWYHDLHKKANDAMARFIQQLEEDGLMEDTFIFYYGDHGGVLPRSKGYIYESGLHIPMVVYVPEKWQHLAPAERGSRIDGFVQFIDLAPTVLNLAGLEIPQQIDGKPFLGKGVTESELNSRNTIFSYADRFDEKYDLVRGFRKGKYKYIRNYQPFNFDGLHNFYRYRMLAYQEWEQLFKEGKLNDHQQQFFLARPAEVLYDLEKDPHEVNNLAGDPAHQTILEDLRKELQQQVKSMPDLSFFPEPYFLEKGIGNPVAFGQQRKKEIGELIEVADLSLLPFAKAKKRIKKALKSSNPWNRYWGLIVCSSFGKEAEKFAKKAKKIASKDKENLVRVRAAEFLGLNGFQAPQGTLIACLKEAKTITEANLILNSVALLIDSKPGHSFNFDRHIFNPDWMTDKNDLVLRRMEYIETK